VTVLPCPRASLCRTSRAAGLRTHRSPAGPQIRRFQAFDGLRPSRSPSGRVAARSARARSGEVSERGS
jgi:hypothetical protein